MEEELGDAINAEQWMPWRALNAGDSWRRSRRVVPFSARVRNDGFELLLIKVTINHTDRLLVRSDVARVATPIWHSHADFYGPVS